jgi:hypothetical protein
MSDNADSNRLVNHTGCEEEGRALGRLSRCAASRAGRLSSVQIGAAAVAAAGAASEAEVVTQHD